MHLLFKNSLLWLELGHSLQLQGWGGGCLHLWGLDPCFRIWLKSVRASEAARTHIARLDKFHCNLVMENSLIIYFEPQEYSRKICPFICKGPLKSSCQRDRCLRCSASPLWMFYEPKWTPSKSLYVKKKNQNNTHCYIKRLAPLFPSLSSPDLWFLLQLVRFYQHWGAWVA